MNLVGKVGGLVMLLFSICEINAGKFIIINETGQNLREVKVWHWGISGETLNKTYEITKDRRILHDLILDRLARISIESVGMPGIGLKIPKNFITTSAKKQKVNKNVILGTDKSWKNKDASSKDRTVRITIKKESGMRTFVIK